MHAFPLKSPYDSSIIYKTFHRIIQFQIKTACTAQGLNHTVLSIQNFNRFKMLKSMQPVTFPVNCTRNIYTFHQGQRDPATTESEPYCRNGGFRGAPAVLIYFPPDFAVPVE